MARPKGAPKVGGRVKGTPNKIKLGIRMKMSDFIIDHFNDFVKYWEELPKDSPAKFSTYINVLKYVLPPIAAEPLSEEGTESTAASAISKSIEDLKNASK